MRRRHAIRGLRFSLPAFLLGATAWACDIPEGVTPEEEKAGVPRAAFVNLSGEFWLFDPGMEEVTGSPFRLRVSERDCPDGGIAYLDVGPNRIRFFDDARDPTVLDRVGVETTTRVAGCDGDESETREPFRVSDGIHVASPDSIWFDWHHFCGSGTVCLGPDGEVNPNLDRGVRTVEGFSERVQIDGHAVTLKYYREGALPVEPPK